MKVTLEMVLRMEKETMKTIKRHTPENGAMI
jgi:hypothetical protein